MENHIIDKSNKTRLVFLRELQAECIPVLFGCKWNCKFCSVLLLIELWSKCILAQNNWTKWISKFEKIYCESFPY
jgi:hypothetical protein